MRTIRYYIINKTTNESIYTNCSEKACREHLATLPNKEEYTIGYKWLSI